MYTIMRTLLSLPAIGVNHMLYKGFSLVPLGYLAQGLVLTDSLASFLEAVSL